MYQHTEGLDLGSQAVQIPRGRETGQASPNRSPAPNGPIRWPATCRLANPLAAQHTVSSSPTWDSSN